MDPKHDEQFQALFRELRAVDMGLAKAFDRDAAPRLAPRDRINYPRIAGALVAIAFLAAGVSVAILRPGYKSPQVAHSQPVGKGIAGSVAGSNPAESDRVLSFTSWESPTEPLLRDVDQWGLDSAMENPSAPVTQPAPHLPRSAT